MNRRDLLASIGGVGSAVVAGCTDFLDDGTPSGTPPGTATATETNTPTPSPSGGTPTDAVTLDGTVDVDSYVPRRRVSVVQVDPDPDVIPVEFSVLVGWPYISRARMAVIVLTTRNTGESAYGVHPPYYKGASRWEGAPGILLYSTRAPDRPRRTLDERDPRIHCWDHPEPFDEALGWTSEGTKREAVPPGEMLVEHLFLADDYSDPGCFPPGIYRFEESQREPEADFEWGFSLEVSDLTDDE